jgi:hypothetical protein
MGEADFFTSRSFIDDPYISRSLRSLHLEYTRANQQDPIR